MENSRNKPHNFIYSYNIFWPNLLALPLPHPPTTTFPSQLHILFFFFFQKTTLSGVLSTICMYWNMVSLAEATSLRKTVFHPQQLSVANRFSVRGGASWVPSHVCARLLAGLILCKSCACRNSCWKLIYAAALSCPANDISLHTSARTAILLPLLRWSLRSEGSGCDIDLSSWDLGTPYSFTLCKWICYDLYINYHRSSDGR